MDLGLAEETWAGECGWLEVTVRGVVYDLRLIESTEFGGECAFNDWAGVPWQALVGIS